MASEQVKVTANIEVEGSEEKVAKTATFNYDFGSGAVEGAQLYGQAVIDKLYTTAARVKVQGIARAMLERGEDQAAIEAFFATYKLGQELARTANPVAALTTQLANMQDDAAIETLKKLAAARGLSLESLI